MDRKIQAVVLLLAFLISLLIPFSLPQTEEHGNLEAWIELKAYDSNGNLLWTDMHRDPLTLNFARWLELYFLPGSGTVSVTDMSGAARSLCTGGGSPCNFYYFPYSTYGSTACGGAHLYVYIQVGSGTNAPSINDYALQTVVATAQASNPTISTSGNKANISISASFTFSSQTTISEIGTYTPLCTYSSQNKQNYLLARDVLPTAKTVPAGGQLTVTWILRINP